MNVTLTSLEALILKATHESFLCPDAAALEAFCAVMRDSPEGPALATQALAARIHTQNAREALLALAMLDRCMRRCDATFHAEVGKFRFLNELIKLVSPKYFADRTAPEVRTRVLQLLHTWSIEYPKESKFKVAFDMLRNQGVVKEIPPPLPPEDAAPARVTKSSIFEDEKKSSMLQKLLQSTKPGDVVLANKIIKTIVREDERRTEASSRRALEVSSALDSAGLLREMLERSADATPDEKQLIHELRARCAKMRPALQKMANSAGIQQESLGDILYACDELDEVMQKYNSFATDTKRKDKCQYPTRVVTLNDSLLDFAGATAGAPKSRVSGNVLDELGDIFVADGTPEVAEPLKPVSLMDTDLLGDRPDKTEAWNDLNSLGEQLLKQSLPDNAKRVDNFNSKQTKKIPMNALEKSPNQPEAENGSLLDLDFFNKQPVKTASPLRPLTPTDDAMVDISHENAQSSSNPTSNTISKHDSPPDCIIDLGPPLGNGREANVDKSKNKQENGKKNHVKPLTDINVTLESVQPSSLTPVTAFEDGGLTVTLHFCKDKPRADVNVIVISTASKNRSSVEDYKFQVVVPKGCKSRLLTPSGTSLPAYNPFLPPPALTQVLLVARPEPPPPLNLKFVITYTCDEETFSEMGEVKVIPLDDI